MFGKETFRRRSERSERKERKVPQKRTPDAPKVETQKLGEIDIFVPNGVEHTVKSLFAESREAYSNGHSHTKGRIYTPLAKIALTPEFKTRYGGGRFGGGGTSEESLSRAKVKSKRKKRGAYIPPRSY